MISDETLFTLYFKVLFMSKEQYQKDLSEIKDMMERSSRFISLSGISGVLAGIFALIGAYLAYKTVYSGQEYFSYRIAELSRNNLYRLFLIAITTLVFSLGAGIFFTAIKTKREGRAIWDYQSRRLLTNLFIPLISGGLLCLVLLLEGYTSLVAPLTLMFYGLGLVNASKYSLPELRSLGLVEILLGLIAVCIIGYGLLFWALGFGILHIIYGIVMHIRYRT